MIDNGSKVISENFLENIAQVISSPSKTMESTGHKVHAFLKCVVYVLEVRAQLNRFDMKQC